MNLNFQAGKTPLASRQNPVIYLVIVVVLIFAAIMTGLWFIQMLRRKRMDSPEFQEQEKNRVTKKSDCFALIKKYGLAPEYINILWFVCKKFQIPNIFYSIKTFDQLNNKFKEAYLSLKQSGDESLVNQLFKLKFDLDKIFSTTVVYSSTNTIPLKTRMKLVLKRNMAIPAILYENEKNYLSIQVPENFIESKYKPDEMERIAFTFVSQTGLAYAFITRFIRWQKQGDKTFMIVNHTPHLMTKTQRSFKRINVNTQCTFSSVKVKKNENGEKEFNIGEKVYSAHLSNISGGGCCIASSLPIKENQMIQFHTDLGNGDVTAIGKIVKSKKTNIQGVYNLHIQFTKIGTVEQNKILAKVYGYE